MINDLYLFWATSLCNDLEKGIRPWRSVLVHMNMYNQHHYFDVRPKEKMLAIREMVRNAKDRLYDEENKDYAKHNNA